MIRALIVDDEPLARTGLRQLLEREDDVDVVGECENGLEAVQAIEEGDVDLLFLDVQMPGLDGFEMLRSLERERWPEVIFVTAFDAYAVEAFEVHAIDYLLKPVAEERLGRALERARARLESSDSPDLEALLERIAERPAGLNRMVVKSRGRSFFVNYDEIDWIEAEGNYVALHAGGKTHLVRDTMTAVAERLEPHGFARIHRSSIVNIARIREIQPWFKGDLLVVLEDGTELSLTRTYRKALEERLGHAL